MAGKGKDHVRPQAVYPIDLCQCMECHDEEELDLWSMAQALSCAKSRRLATEVRIRRRILAHIDVGISVSSCLPSARLLGM